MPGPPKVESVAPNATRAKIEFSRAEEMSCFSTLNPFKLLTEIVVFADRQIVQNRTFVSHKSFSEALYLHDLVPFTNYTFSLRQRPLQKLLWSNLTFSTFSTVMTSRHIFYTFCSRFFHQ